MRGNRRVLPPSARTDNYALVSAIESGERRDERPAHPVKVAQTFPRTDMPPGNLFKSELLDR